MKDNKKQPNFVKPPDEKILEALERVLKSQAFSESPRLREFLRFVSLETQEGRGDRLKAYTVGLEVFGKPSSFDPQTDSIVRVEASRLRRLLQSYFAAEGRDDSIYIELPTGGYRPVFKIAANRPPEKTVTPWWRRPAMVAFCALSIVAVIGIALFSLARIQSPSFLPPSSSSGVEEAGLPVLLVLPFSPMPAEPELELIASGLADELIGWLTRFSELRVLGRHTSFAAFQEDISYSSIRARLKADYVLEGSVRTTGDKFVINAQLVSTIDSKTLWSHTHAELQSVMGILHAERDIAQSIVTTIAQPDGVIAADQFTRETAVAPNMAAYRCILQAYRYWHSYARNDFDAARDCLELTVERHPGFAPALAMLTYFLLDEYRLEYGAGKDRRTEALVVAQKAVRLAPSSATAFQALAEANYVSGDIDGFRRASEQALRLNPNNPDILANYGAGLIVTGQKEKGVALMKKARTLNPIVPVWFDFYFGLAAYLDDDGETAANHAKRIIAPGYVLGHVLKTVSAVQAGEMERARLSLTRLLAAKPEFANAPRGFLQRSIPTRSVVNRLIEDLEKAGLHTS